MQQNRYSGFILVELLVTRVIAAILLTIGVPWFVQFINNNQLSAVRAELVTTLSLFPVMGEILAHRMSLSQSGRTVTLVQPVPLPFHPPGPRARICVGWWCIRMWRRISMKFVF